MPRTTYTLLLVAVAVVVGGMVYVLRPEARQDSFLAITPEVTPSPMTDDSTIPWPPPAPGADIEPITTVVSVTLKTNKGDIVIALDGSRAPLTVGNFVKLANEDFYDGTTFHRVIPDFMIQGGDPLSKDLLQRDKHGTGDPGYKFPDEINAESYGLHTQKLSDVVDPSQLTQLPPEAKDFTVKQFYEAQGYQYTTEVESLPLQQGVLAMANSGPNTNGSQFFIITAQALPHLQGKHTPFGIVQQGMDIVMAISGVERDANDNPVSPVIIEDVTVATDSVINGLEGSAGLQPLE